MAREVVDPYVDPVSGTLHNKPGLRHEGVLRQFEYEQSALRIAELRQKPIAGRYDLGHLMAIHAHVFQDVYAWAGDLRTINLSKGGSSFVRSSEIGVVGARLAVNLEREDHLRGLAKDSFVERLAHHHAAWNALHPFREGNGRALREFFGQLAREAGYEFDQTRLVQARGEWNMAARLSMVGELGPTRELLSHAVRPSRALAFEKLPQAEAVARHPDLQGAYDGLRAMRETLAERYKGNAQAQEHFYAQARSEVVRRLDTGQVLDAMRQGPAQGTERAVAAAPQVEVSASRGARGPLER